MLRLSIFASAIIAIAMAAFSLLVISYAGAKDVGASANLFHYFKSQSVFAVLAVCAAIVAGSVNYHFYKRKWVMYFLLGATLISLALVLTPGVGVAVKGSRRWIELGFCRVQPAEFAKLAIVLIMSAHMDRLGGLVNTMRLKTLLIPMLLGGGVAVGLILQPDFGSTIIACALLGLMLLVGGWGWKKCFILLVCALAGIAIALMANENRMKRLQNEGDNSNYQAAQSEIAFRNGGLMGQGLGKGMQRQGYLPECHTDFIFSIVGEDYGLVGTGATLILFVLLLGCGTTVALHAPDKQGMLLAFGATMIICAQAAANMAVVTHLLPTKGLALPFFSYGGSSILSSSIALGLIINVGRIASHHEANPVANAKVIHSIS